MQDRVPLYPGRVKLVPVAGQENTYDMTRADQPTQAGDPLNKATLWSDATAALFGLGVDSVPDDGFAWLGKYNQHWWRRRTFVYAKKETLNAKEVTIISGGVAREIFYAKDISVNNSTGEITFTNQQSINTTRGAMGERLQEQAPCYIKNIEGDPSTVYFLPAGCTRFDSNNYVPPTQYTIYNYFGSANKEVLGYPSTNCASVITSEKSNGDWEYVQSSNRSAYPDSGEQDGYEYEYMGIPFDNAVNSPKIETGSYVGTGKYGVDNPNSLTFSFIPKIVWLLGCKGSTEWFGHVKLADNESGVIPCEYLTTKYKQAPPYGGSSAFNYCFSKRSQDKRTIYWYYSNNNRGSQFNSPNTTYYYIAFG